MTTGRTREQAFRRLLTREAGTGAGAPAIAAAVRVLGEHLAQHLAQLVGDAGVAAIYDRGLHLTRSRFPGLTTGRSSDQRAPLARAQLSLEHQESAVAADAGVALLTTVSESLASFIGEGLTTRLLHVAWPDDFADEPRRSPHD